MLFCQWIFPRLITPTASFLLIVKQNTPRGYSTLVKPVSEGDISMHGQRCGGHEVKGL